MTRELLYSELVPWLEAHPGTSPWVWANIVLDDRGSWKGDLQFTRFVSGQISRQQDQHEDPLNATWRGRQFYMDSRRAACELGKEAGLQGGYRVAHPYRLQEWVKPHLREEGYGWGGEEGTLWDGVLCDALELGDWRKYVKLGMHTHFIGPTGQRGTPQATLHTAGGDDVVVERFEDQDTDTIWGLYRACLYPLTHAAPPDGTRVAGPFGDVHQAASRNPRKRLADLNEQRKGGNLEILVETVLDHVLDEILGNTGTDKEGQPNRCCPSCEGTDYVSLFQITEVLAEERIAREDIDHWPNLDVAMALSRWGPTSKIPRMRALDYGFITEDELELLDPCNAIDVHKLLGLALPDHLDGNHNDAPPAEPPPDGGDAHG